MTRRIAAIDFGTNTARLLIADLEESGRFSPVCIEREIVRMGGGFTREAGLSAEAIVRGCSCLARFAVSIWTHGVDEVRAVATSAVRDAPNGERFRERILDETGISLQVIDGTTEGTLTLAGVLSGLDRRHDDLLIFDVGGGSTEYTVARSGNALFVASLPLGVVRLTEGKGNVEGMSDKIRRELEALRGKMAQAGCTVAPGTVLVGTAGTATTLAAISLEMDHYDYRRVNNHVLSRQEVEEIYRRLAILSPAERLLVPGLEKGREDLIIAGCLLTLSTMEMFGMEAIKISDYGLLEGIVAAPDFPSRDGGPQLFT